ADAAGLRTRLPTGGGPHIIAVLGARRASGCTTTAALLAETTAGVGAVPVGVVDLTIPPGTLARRVGVWPIPLLAAGARKPPLPDFAKRVGELGHVEVLSSLGITALPSRSSWQAVSAWERTYSCTILDLGMASTAFPFPDLLAHAQALVIPIAAAPDAAHVA